MRSQIIKGDTQLIGLFGNPVTHSLSPLFQNHILKTLNLPFVYVPLQFSKNQLPVATQALRAFNFKGANVTIPYKKDVLPYCDVLSELSYLIKAVNTLYFKNGLLHGTTTDSEGFFKALTEMNHSMKKGNVVLLGNGGTARTLGFAMAIRGDINSLTLVGRNKNRVEKLASEIKSKTGYPIRSALFKTTKCNTCIKESTLLVNTTSVGMAPHIELSPLPKELFHNKMAVFDVIYNPSETLFLKYAKLAGCKVQNGLRMLLYQGLESFQYWTGKDISIDIFDLKEIQSLIS